MVNTCLSSGYTPHHTPGNTGGSGGCVIAIYIYIESYGYVGVPINNQIKVKSRIECVNSEITSFESMELVITISSITIRLSVIYRMPPVKSKKGITCTGF